MAPTSDAVGAQPIPPLRFVTCGRKIASYVVDLLSTSLVLLKLPVAVAISITVAIVLVVGVVGMALQVMRFRTRFVCDLPALSRLSVCGESLALAQTPTIMRADFPSLVKIQNIVLDDLIDQSSSGTDFALNVKHAELAVRDLVVLVQASNLTIKIALADALIEFAMDARAASRGLQRLTAHINGAVDSVSSFNVYAYRAIEAAQQRGPREVGATVLCTFQASMSGFSSQIGRVTLEAATTMTVLDMLEDRLFTIHELCVQETFATAVALDGLLWELWTIVGGNQARLHDLRDRAAVLKEVEHYRAVSLAYVAATSQTLLRVDAELSELRDRLNEFVVAPQYIPVEVQLASVERSILRLQQAGTMGRARFGHLGAV